jgi:hypothetical protein
LSPDASAANASLVAPFGVTAVGDINSPRSFSQLNLKGPLTGPFTPVSDFATDDPGWFRNSGAGTVFAEFSSTEYAILYTALTR